MTGSACMPIKTVDKAAPAMSAGRAAPWRSKPSQELQALVVQLSQPSSTGSSSNSSWYVLQRPGPSSFVVGQDPGDDKFKVALGNQPTCSCRTTTTFQQEPCVHLLFIMLRVMRLSADNPLLWQSALTDRELQELLDGRMSSSRGTGRLAARRSSSCSSGKPDSSVQRRTIEQDEPCPICYESLSNVEPGWLVWCSHSCGKSIHGCCMRVWSEHQTKTLQQELSCPLCRCPWGKLDWSPPATLAAPASGKAAAHARNCHKGVSCSGCNQTPIEGSRHRCLECAAVNLCNACFTAGQHLQHSFVCCATATAPEQLAERPMHLGLQCAGVAQGTAAAAASSDAGQQSRSSTGGRGISSGEVSRQNSSSSSRRTAGTSQGGKVSNQRSSSALSQAAGAPMQLGSGLQGSSLRHHHVDEHSAAQANSSSSSSRTGSSTSRTGSRGDAGMHDRSSNHSRQFKSSREHHVDSAKTGSMASPAAAAGAAAVARAAAAAVGSALQQAAQGIAAMDSLDILCLGGQLNSAGISRSLSSAGSAHSSLGGQLTHSDCVSSTGSGACQRSNSSSKPASRGSLPLSSSSRMPDRAPARRCGHLHAGRKPADAVQHDFAALVLSGHIALGNRAAAAAAPEGFQADAGVALPQHGAAAVARAAAAAARQCANRPAGHAVPGQCIGKGPVGGRAGSCDKLQVKRLPNVTARPEQQQVFAVLGLRAVALHPAQQ